MPASGGAPEEITSGAAEGHWSVAENRVYLRTPFDARPQVIRVYDMLSLASEVVYTFGSDAMPSPSGTSVAASPDGRWILFAQIDRTERDIMLVENFR
jgi:hypothetical protein